MEERERGEGRQEKKEASALISFLEQVLNKCYLPCVGWKWIVESRSRLDRNHEKLGQRGRSMSTS